MERKFRIDPGKVENSITLEKLRFSVSKVFNGHVLVSMKVEEYFDEIIQGIVYGLEAEVMAEKLQEDHIYVTMDIPKSWWQYFKKDYFPGWLLQKFSVKFNTLNKKVIFKRYATYPQLARVFSPNELGKIVYKEFINNEEAFH